jgi:hypothetical protein
LLLFIIFCFFLLNLFYLFLLKKCEKIKKVKTKNRIKNRVKKVRKQKLLNFNHFLLFCRRMKQKVFRSFFFSSFTISLKTYLLDSKKSKEKKLFSLPNLI